MYYGKFKQSNEFENELFVKKWICIITYGHKFKKYHIQTLKILKTYYGKFYQSNQFENELFLNKKFVFLPMVINSKKYHMQISKTLKTSKMYYGKF